MLSTHHDCTSGCEKSYIDARMGQLQLSPGRPVCASAGTEHTVPLSLGA